VRVASFFARRETRVTCRDMVHGVLAEVEDHNCLTAPSSSVKAFTIVPRYKVAVRDDSPATP
jgi:hypothetical protein